MYLDSKTTYKSVVKSVAKELGVKVVENNIFMDDVYSREHIAKQAIKVHKHVKEHDATIIIGHVGSPGKNTAEVLKESVPEWKKIAQFVTISNLVR